MKVKLLSCDELSKSIALKIKIRRIGLNISIEKLANLMDVSVITARQYESGLRSRNIPIYKLYCLSIHLKVPMQYFFEDTVYNYDKEEVYEK